MNERQELWWRQACSDHVLLTLLRRQGAPPCHQLHYLQMATEKLGKAYFWRSGHPPPKKHTGFAGFLRAMVAAQPSNRREQVAELFSFGRFQDLQNWTGSVMPLAYKLECLAPTLANDGPNPEYPWPHASPQYAPVTYHFDFWTELIGTGRGHRLLKFVKDAVEKFPSYG